MNLKKEKRITVKLNCPNPLFEEWLTMWRDQAVAKDSQFQYSLNLALKSLKKYPLPLDSGRECMILKGFGSKLCKMLDDQLIEYKKSDIAIQGFRNLNRHNNDPVNSSGDLEPEIRSNTNVMGRAPNKAKGTPIKEYIPEYGSGGYAILIALYKQSLQPNYVGSLNKAEIIKYGKDLVNSSFTKPDPGSRYTAWSSMRTLLTKNLITKMSHPPRFSLTEKGTVLARKLYENSLSDKDETSNFHSKNNSHRTYDDNDDDVIVIPDEFLWNPMNSETGSVSMFNSGPKKNTEVPSYHLNRNNICLQEKVIVLHSNSQDGSTIQNKIFGKCASSSSISFEKETVEENLDHEKTAQTLQKNNSTNISATSSTNDVLKASSKSFFKKYTSSSSVTSTKSIFENFVMAAYSFDIILYVDTGETSGSSNSEGDDVLIELKRFGIHYEIKSLKVGDFAWVCKDRLSDKELILPYIIERKRMDDFAHSIKDRRYHEQKFRLKKSGIENLTYLVESHGRNQHVGLPVQTLYQAATNTAIQENFFIKFTENSRETVKYLVNFSKLLVAMFEAKTLASCTKNDVKPLDINSDVITLMTFKEFNESSMKNKRMKVTDLFVKMLIQTKGMSVERALAITQQYPTPFLLKKAYESNSDSVSEKLLSNIKYGAGGKNLGAVLSKTVYQLFSKTQY